MKFRIQDETGEITLSPSNEAESQRMARWGESIVLARDAEGVYRGSTLDAGTSAAEGPGAEESDKKPGARTKK